MLKEVFGQSFLDNSNGQNHFMQWSYSTYDGKTIYIFTQ